MKPIRLLIALLLTVVLTAAAHAQTPKVRYSLAAYAPGTTTKLTTVKAGSDFDLALFTQDLRPAGEYQAPDGTTKPLLRGVWAAYARINVNTAAIKIGAVNWTSSIYVNGKQFAPSSTGISVLGAFDGFSAIGSDLLEVCRVQCTAQWPAGISDGTTQISRTFSLNFSNLPHPQCDTLVLGNWAANPPEQSDVQLGEIVASGVTLTITK